MAQYDVYDIESRLKEYDPDLFRRIEWDDKRALHRIICFDPQVKEEYVAFTVPHGQLDHRTVCDFMRINPRNGYNPFDELESYFDKRDKHEQQKITSMATDLAENIYNSFRMKPSRAID